MQPHAGDVAAAVSIYGESHVKRTTAFWRRAGDGDATLRDDFLSRPESVARHSDGPLAVTNTAEAFVNDIYFPKELLSLASSDDIPTPGHASTLVQPTSAGH